MQQYINIYHQTEGYNFINKDREKIFNFFEIQKDSKQFKSMRLPTTANQNIKMMFVKKCESNSTSCWINSASNPLNRPKNKPYFAILLNLNNIPNKKANGTPLSKNVVIEQIKQISILSEKNILLPLQNYITETNMLDLASLCYDYVSPSPEARKIGILLNETSAKEILHTYYNGDKQTLNAIHPCIQPLGARI